IRDGHVTGVQTCALPISFWGAAKLGAVAVPVNTLMTPQEYEFILTDSRAPVAIVEESVAGRLLAVRHRCPALRAVVVVGSQGLRSEERRVGKEGRAGWGA